MEGANRRTGNRRKRISSDLTLDGQIKKTAYEGDLELVKLLKAAYHNWITGKLFDFS